MPLDALAMFPAVGTTATERRVVTFSRVRTFVVDAEQSLPPS
jgi:hypothetical protein